MESEHADGGYVVAAYLLVAVGVIGAILLANKNAVEIGVSEGFAPFAVIYIVAQAIERLMQPITGFTAKAEEKEEKEGALAKAKAAHAKALTAGDTNQAGQHGEDATKHQKALQRIQADRAAIYWAVATLLALLACGALELGLIQSIANVSGKSGGVPHWFRNLDIAITGIAIGSGTKPLHDLISFIQNTKQKTDSAPASS
jgi:hypothetical protein